MVFCNEIIFNYILKEGVSRQYIALELLKKNGFDDDVIENALEICKKIKENKLVFFNNKQDKQDKQDKQYKKDKKDKKIKKKLKKLKKTELLV
jgi:DNA mismatch repair ATPase MutS